MIEPDLYKHYKRDFENRVLIEQGGTDRIRAFYLKPSDNLDGRMESTYFLFTPEGVNILGDLCPGNDGRNSGVHAFGYSLGWFAGRLSHSYLCEKFLEERWQYKLAAQWCRDKAKDILRGEHDDEFKELRNDAEERKILIQDELLSYRKNLRLAKGDNDQEAIADNRGYIAEVRGETAALRRKIMMLRRQISDDYDELAYEMENGESSQDHLYERLRDLEDFDAGDGLPGYGYEPRSQALLCALQETFSKLYWENLERAETSIGSADLSQLLPGGVL